MTLPKMKLSMDRYFIYLRKEGIDEQVRFNLKDMCMEKKKGTESWRKVEHQYCFFMNYEIDDLIFNTEKFRKLFLLVRKLNPNCKSISSFITRIPECVKYEGYIDAGLEIDVWADIDSWGTYHVRGIHEPITIYDKNVIKFFKRYEIKVTKNIEKNYLSHTSLIIKFIHKLPLSKLDEEEIKQTFRELVGYRSYSSSMSTNFLSLINEHNFDMISLIEYIVRYLKPFENIEFSDALNLLKDYYEMGATIGRKVKKYPKYLRSMHDILTANYNAYKTEYDEIAFEHKMRKDMVFEEGKFCIVIPNCSKDVVREGTELNHCVSSYVKKIIKGQTYIMFLRLKKTPEDSLVTVELKNETISEALGSYNRHINEEESAFLVRLVKTKGLRIADKLVLNKDHLKKIIKKEEMAIA